MIATNREMEVTLLGHKYNIPEGWVSRWDLLSNYREDTGLDEIEVPTSSHITKEEMDGWIELNKKMNAWKIVEKRSSYHIKKVDLRTINRVVQYFSPSSGEYLSVCDFSSFPQSDRIQFLRELGRWKRREIITTNSDKYKTLISDPYRRLSLLAATKLERIERAREVLEGLIELAEKLPVDILYGLIASSGPISDGVKYTGEGDWRTMLWNDAYDSCLQLQEEWETACVNMLRYYLEHEELTSLSILRLGDFHSVLAPLTLNPSNEVRIFADKELVAIVNSDTTLHVTSDMTDEDILMEVRKYSSEHVVPDLLGYEWKPEVLTRTANTRQLSVDLSSLPSELDSTLWDLRSSTFRLSAPIPDTAAFFNRIYEYVEKHPSWLTYDILFGEESRRLNDSDDVLIREESMSFQFDILSMVRDGEEVSQNEADKCVDIIRHTLGTRCLMAMASCIIGAVEKESLLNYSVNSPLYADYGPEYDEKGQNFLLLLAESALKSVEENGLTDFVSWPILSYSNRKRNYVINLPAE